MERHTRYDEILHQEGLKSTKHRNSVLELLQNSHLPLYAEQIYLEIREKSIPISLSSVYRILDSLVSKGLVERTSVTGDNRALYELERPEHKHYLVCSVCKKMLPAPNCPLSGYEKQLEQSTGFIASGHRLEITGICKECANKR